MRAQLHIPFVLLCLFGACKDKEKDPPGDTFDKEVMLANIGSNVIIPAYAALNNELKSFESLVHEFESARTLDKLDQVREQFTVVYTQWQRCSVYEFGPAENRTLRLAFNTFPTDTARVLANVSTGDNNHGSAQNALAVGLPAIEFLLFAKADASESLVLFEGPSNPRLTHLTSLISHLSDMAGDVHSEWISSGGNYIQTFRSNTSSSAGSSISLLVNQINFEYELIKNARIGIPLGKKTLGVVQPEKVEAPYSDLSLDLALTNLEALQTTFNGGTNIGFDDHLNALGAKHGTAMLSARINDGFADVRAKLMAIPEPLQSSVTSHPTQVEAAYQSLMELLVLLKSDMPSQLGIQITYQDNDGD